VASLIVCGAPANQLMAWSPFSLGQFGSSKVRHANHWWSYHLGG